MQAPEVKAFKNELRNYNFYHERVRKLSSLIDFCYDQLPGSVHGLDPSKESVHGPRDIEREYRIRDEISHHEQNRAFTQAKIDYIDQILGKTENTLREALKRVYVEGDSCVSVARKMNMSPSGLKYCMDQAIKKALRD